MKNLENFDDIWGQLGDPSLVEQKFLELLPQAAGLQDQSIYLQMLSQLALAQAVLKKFDAAHATLDQLEKLLTSEHDLAKVRMLCERGRVFHQAGDIAQARLYFEQSYALSLQCHFDKQTINAAHMIAIVAPTCAEKIAWNTKALNLALSTNDLSAQSWRGPLCNNLGANYLEVKDYEKALQMFQLALQEFEKNPNYHSNTRFARFKVAQLLRLLGRFEQALQMLQEQVQEHDAMTISGQIDMPAEMFALMRGWLYEELALFYRASKQLDLSKKYAHLALSDLEQSVVFTTTEPAAGMRLQQLRQI